MKPAERLSAYIDEGRLIRKEWTGKDDAGRATACLLAVLAPECGKKRTAAACPAEVMPKWLAELTPGMDDEGSAEAWPAMVRRYASVAARWHALTAAEWAACEVRVKVLCIREAMSQVTVDEWGVLVACSRVIECLEAGIDAAAVTATAALEVAAAAAAAAEAAPAAAAREAAAEAVAARDAAWAAAVAWEAAAEAVAARETAAAAAAASAAEAAVAARAAAWAAAAAVAWEAAAEAVAARDAAAAAAWAAWDRMNDGILSILESACTEKENAQ
jgi:hypothetical protein